MRGVRCWQLDLKPSMPNKTSSYYLRQSSTIDDAVEAGVMQFVISQVGWLSWEDYIWLVVASKRGGFAGVVTLLIWTRDPKRLEKEVTFLSSLLNQSDIAPFAPVLRKVIERYMLEVEVRKKHLKAVQKRYRDFASYGRSLNFGYKELEEDIADGESSPCT